MTFAPETATLAQWLQRLESLHPTEIELGLERVKSVGRRLNCLRPAPLVILVGGTNGKGTTSALLAALLRAQGLKVGVYCSPHIHRYNERVTVDGAEVSDEQLCASFRAVEAVRGDTSLTYFEFGTLSALWCFAEQNVDACVLEIGLGGRLDAVNMVEPDVSVVTSIGLDHQAWLGNTLNEIAYEKVSIARSGQYLICGQPNPPERARATADAIGARWLARGEDFSVESLDSGLSVRFTHNKGQVFWHLPHAQIPYHNVATAIQTLAAIGRLPDETTVADVVKGLRVPGRLQTFVREREGRTLRLTLDVAHNEQAAEYIGRALQQVDGIILGMLADKDAAAVARVLPSADQLLLVTLNCPRGLTAEALANKAGFGQPVQQFDDVAAAMQRLPDEGHWLVCGSFYTVEAAMEVIKAESDSWNSI
ncbi:bifunctional tetrahydrofolate synthase/dihydrofolate synthase [Thalassolituus sp. LLYu03]|uniref:bifunctional tetrahydrofolate synthase/dihydrofolate synthase n=1 Tax=Thalassolituus sp. LLYu03 TaxID=3421656 RepID=UPI003D285A27